MLEDFGKDTITDLNQCLHAQQDMLDRRIRSILEDYELVISEIKISVRKKEKLECDSTSP